MSDLDLSGYKVTFGKGTLLATWSWAAIAPNGEKLCSFGLHSTKESAERQALRFIENHAQAESMTGATLRERVTARPKT